MNCQKSNSICLGNEEIAFVVPYNAVFSVKTLLLSMKIIYLPNCRFLLVIISCTQRETFGRILLETRMHSSRMRTGRTVTVFRKLEDPPRKIWSRHPPQKFGAGTPPENLEQAPPRKFGAGTPPENLEQAPPL